MIDLEIIYMCLTAQDIKYSWLRPCLDGQRVLPARAKELGFQFKYPRVKDALKTILS